MKYLLNQKEYDHYQDIQRIVHELSLRNELIGPILDVMRGISLDTDEHAKAVTFTAFTNDLLFGLTTTSKDDVSSVYEVINAYRERPKNTPLAGMYRTQQAKSEKAIDRF